MDTALENKQIKLPDVSQDIRNAIEKEIQTYPQTQNWASNLGFPCLRNLVYRRLDWDKKPKISVTSKMIFNGGTVIEKYIAKDYLEKAGYEIMENNTPIQSESSGLFRKYQIGGRLDFLCRSPHDRKFIFPVETKSMSPWDWKKIDSIEDLLFSKKTWHNSYPAQLTIYMLAKEYQYGMFLLINKQTFEPKHIWVDLNYTYAEDLLKKAEQINLNVELNQYPDRIEYDDDICGKCDFKHICLNDIKNEGIELVDLPELDDRLKREFELKESAKEYKELYDLNRKDAQKVGKDFLTSSYLVQFKTQTRTNYEVPDEVKKDYAVKKDILIPKFIPLEKPSAGVFPDSSADKI